MTGLIPALRMNKKAVADFSLVNGERAVHFDLNRTTDRFSVGEPDFELQSQLVGNGFTGHAA